VEPVPTPAKPVERDPEPTPQVSKPEEPEKPADDPTPLPKPEVHKIEVDLTPVVRKVSKTKHRDNSQAQAEAAEQRAEDKAERDAQRKRQRAISQITSGIRDNLSSSTDVHLSSGESRAATANYGQIVKSMYYNAWNLPDSASSSDASPKVRVVVARDGTVISAHIIARSGDDTVDDSVQRALDRVTFIQPFAESATENERTFTIIFDAQTKRSE
jgi:outer membrane biosynthesis protein TonB